MVRFEVASRGLRAEQHPCVLLLLLGSFSLCTVHVWYWSMNQGVRHGFKSFPSKSFRTGCLEREIQMVQLSATRCSCIAALWVSLVSFAGITLCAASQRLSIVVTVYFVIDSVRKLLDTTSYVFERRHQKWWLTFRSSITINRNTKSGALLSAHDKDISGNSDDELLRLLCKFM
jgi:hypothetical protein